jgi:hypothetical protein
MSRQDPQINIRIDAARLDVLEAAAFVHGVAVRELVLEAVGNAIDGYERMPTVKKALQARAEQAHATHGKVSPMPRRAERGTS